MTESSDELMKSYEVVRSVVARHGRYDAARILTLNLATCITDESKQDETAVLARLEGSSSFRIALSSGKPSERVLTRIVICGCVCWFKYSHL